MRFRKGEDGKYKTIELDSDFTGHVRIVETRHASGNSVATDIVVTRPSLGLACAFAALSLIFLGVAIWIGWWIFTRLPELGPQFGYAYYGAVVVLGLCAAIVLFGVLRSYAHVTGHHAAISFEVGGAAAVFVLVILGAFYVVPRPDSAFPLTVRLEGDGLDASAVQGLQVTVDLRGRRDPRYFSPTQEAVIPEVPTSMIGQEVHVELSPGRVHLKSRTARIPSNQVLYLPVTVDPARPQP